MIVSRPEKKKKSSRYNVFLRIMAVIFVVIIIRLGYIQVYKHDDYKEEADTTATRFVSEKAPRGIIYDANGNILATNTQTYAMTYTTTQEADKKFFKTIDLALALLSQKGEGLEDNLALKLDGNNQPYYQFKGTTESAKKAEEIRFKRDRGLNEDVEKDLGLKDKDDLKDNEIDEINKKLLEVTPNEMFCYLVKSYDLISLIDPKPEDTKSKEYKEYLERAKKYKEMSGEELTDMLLKSYSYKQLRTYMVVKDAIKMESFNDHKSSVTLARIKDKETAFIIMQKSNDLPGIDIKLEPIRSYPYNELASSVIGYLSPINSTNEEKYKLRGYDSSTDLIGVSGIESSFEDELKGVKGGTTIKVNSQGRKTEELFQLQSYPGNNIHLTIDKNIQYAAEKSLIDSMENLKNSSDPQKGATRGAAVAVDVKTGRILASASYPSFNPNKFATSGGLTDEETKKYFSPDLEGFGKDYIASRGLSKSLDELFPKDKEDGVRTDPYDLYPKAFYNYATLGTLPSGSIFKPLTAIAGLQEGVVGPNETINDIGIYNIHPEVYGKGFGPKCYEYQLGEPPHGPIEVTRALEVSCNFYFYDIAYRLYNKGGQNISALDAIAKYAWRFGLGVDPNGKEKASTGIEIEENYGQVYNFQDYRNNAIQPSKIEIRDFLEAGYYEGNDSHFVPFDYADNENDNEKLQTAKTSLKKTITDAFKKLGTSEEITSRPALEKSMLEDIKTIMNTSDKYKQNIKNYEESGKGKVNMDTQATLVAQAISKYVINDKGSIIKSPGQQVYSAIGQGMDAFTPMQLVQYISTLANGGTKYKLHYVDKITDTDGNLVQEYKPEVLDKIDIRPDVLKTVVEGMKRVNNDDGGTAANVWNGFPIKTAGKTGTADVREDQKDYGRAPYATYVSFAPADNPEIAVVAVVYDGGHGSFVAPVAKAVYEAYFKERLGADYISKSSTYKKYVTDAPKDKKIN